MRLRSLRRNTERSSSAEISEKTTVATATVVFVYDERRNHKGESADDAFSFAQDDRSVPYGVRRMTGRASPALRVANVLPTVKRWRVCTAVKCKPAALCRHAVRMQDFERYTYIFFTYTAFQGLTEQEKRERGVGVVSLYEPFAVLRENVVTAKGHFLWYFLSCPGRKKHTFVYQDNVCFF